MAAISGLASGDGEGCVSVNIWHLGYLLSFVDVGGLDDTE